jgi:hypothetical protein
MDLLHPFFCPFTRTPPDGKLGVMRKQLSIFILVLTASLTASAVKSNKKTPTKKAVEATPVKPLNLQTGSSWILAKDLTLQKTGLTPEEFVPYTSIWDLKKKSFISTSSSSSDSCEFRATVSKKVLKTTSVKIKKDSAFKITGIQETTMSILIDATSRDSRQAGIDQIQITCSAYEQGLDSPELKEKFKGDLAASLANVFTGKN